MEERNKNLNNRELFILGAGTYGEVIFELAEDCGYNVAGFYDDNEDLIGKVVMGVPVLDSIQNLLSRKEISGCYAIAIGSNTTRYSIGTVLQENGADLPAVIHPEAQVSKYAKIGSGTLVHASSFVFAKTEIGAFCIISPMVMVSHHTKIDDGVFISAGSTVGAYITLEKKVFIGMASNVMTGVKIVGEDALIGGGAVIIKDVAENSVMVGNPGRFLRKNKS